MRRPVGVKWVLLSFRWTRFFFGRVATVATLPSPLLVERFYSLGASWAFSFQPVLPPDYRPPVPSLGWKLGQAIDAVTETRLWALCLLPNWIPPLGCCLRGCCAAVRRLLRSPTVGAARRPAFVRWRSRLVSSRASRHVQPVSGPSAADRCRRQTGPECDVLPAPAAFADRDLLPC